MYYTTSIYKSIMNNGNMIVCVCLLYMMRTFNEINRRYFMH